MIAVGGGYTTPGQTDLRIIRNRNSRYLFNILDTGGDGICCNTGTQGSFKIFVDSVVQADKGKFGTSDTVLFGEEVCNDVTFKLTNVVSHVALVCPQRLFQLYLLFILLIALTADCEPNQQCQFRLVSCLILKIRVSVR